MICISSNQYSGNLSNHSEPLQDDSKTTMRIESLAQSIFTGEGLLVLSVLVITFFYTRPPDCSKEIDEIFSRIDKINGLIAKDNEAFSKRMRKLNRTHGKIRSKLEQQEELREELRELRKQFRSQPIWKKKIIYQKQRKGDQEVEVEPQETSS